jgi:hypothetical protein
MKKRNLAIFSAALVIALIAVGYFWNVDSDRDGAYHFMTAHKNDAAVAEGPTSHALIQESASTADNPLRNPKDAAPEQPLAAKVDADLLADTPDTAAAKRKAQQDATRELYDELFKDLRLGDHDTAQLLDLLASSREKLLVIQQAAADQRTRIDQLNNLQKTNNDEVLALLGVKQFYKYEEYERTLTEHIEVLQLTKELASTGTMPLTEKQRKDLFEILVDENKVVPGPARQPPGPKDPVAEQIRIREEYLNRVAERAANVLSTEQLAAFQARQERAIQFQKTAAESKQSNRS